MGQSPHRGHQPPGGGDGKITHKHSVDGDTRGKKRGGKKENRQARGRGGAWGCAAAAPFWGLASAGAARRQESAGLAVAVPTSGAWLRWAKRPDLGWKHVAEGWVGGERGETSHSVWAWRGGGAPVLHPAQGVVRRAEPLMRGVGGRGEAVPPRLARSCRSRLDCGGGVPPATSSQWRYEPDSPKPWHTQCAGPGGGSNSGARDNGLTAVSGSALYCNAPARFLRCNDSMGIEGEWNS